MQRPPLSNSAAFPSWCEHPMGFHSVTVAQFGVWLKLCMRSGPVASADELTGELGPELPKHCYEARDKLLLGGVPEFHETQQLFLLLQGP